MATPELAPWVSLCAQQLCRYRFFSPTAFTLGVPISLCSGSIPPGFGFPLQFSHLLSPVLAVPGRCPNRCPAACPNCLWPAWVPPVAGQVPPAKFRFRMYMWNCHIQFPYAISVPYFHATFPYPISLQYFRKICQRWLLLGTTGFPHRIYISNLDTKFTYQINIPHIHTISMP